MIMVDTDILIDVGRGISEAVACLEKLAQYDQVGISVITYMELMVGCRDKGELHDTEQFLTRFASIDLQPAISQSALGLIRRYRLSHSLLIADALIAASAIFHGYRFISKNQKHYRFLPELQFLPYPEPFPS